MGLIGEPSEGAPLAGLPGPLWPSGRGCCAQPDELWPLPSGAVRAGGRPAGREPQTPLDKGRPLPGRQRVGRVRLLVGRNHLAGRRLINNLVLRMPGKITEAPPKSRILAKRRLHRLDILLGRFLLVGAPEENKYFLGRLCRVNGFLCAHGISSIVLCACSSRRRSARRESALGSGRARL